MSHAQDRAYSRYGLDLKTEEFDELRRQIVEGEAEKLQKKSKNVGIYVCTLNQTRLIVVYHKRNRFFITVLPWCFLDEVKRKFKKRGQK